MRRLLVLAATTALGVGAALGNPAAAPTAFADSGTTPSATPSAGPATATVTATATATATVTATAAGIVATAQQYLGYPYAYIGDDPSTGFSCIGFVHYVFAQHGVFVPEDLSKAYASAPQVDQSQLQPGDLVFFQNTVWNGISHVDLYVGGGKMIGADTFQTGVQWDTLGDAYWQQHYLGATRPLANPTGTPVDPTATPVPSGPSLAPSSGPSLTVKAGMTVTTAHDAAVYSGPSATYTGIDKVTPAMQLTVVQTQGQWVNVSYDGGNQYGWVHGPDLKLPGAAASESSASGSSVSGGTNGSNGSNGSATPGTGSTSHSAAGTTLVVQSATATVYSSPSTNGTALSTVTAGAGVTVLQTQGRWDQVTLPDGTAGWIDGGALGAATPADQSGQGGQGAGSSGTRSRTPRVHVQVVKGFHATHSASTSTSATERKAVVTADVLFVRADASQHARILRRVHAGDRLRILDTKHGWDYVSLRDDSRGWVSAQWVKAARSAA